MRCNRSQCANFAHVFAEVHHGGHGALAIHDAACANGIAHALVNAIFEWNVDVGGIGFKPADAHAVHDVFGTIEGLAAVGGGGDFGGQIVGVDNALDDLPRHVEVLFADVGQGDFNIGKFRHFQNVADQFLGEADGACTDDGNFE